MAKRDDNTDPLAETAEAVGGRGVAADTPALEHTATAHGAAPPTTTADELPPTIGRYQIMRVLGTGGMGVVYAARDPDLDRLIAVKVLLAASEPARVRLLREARAMAKLNHPAVVTVHEVNTASGVDYVAMELIEGDTLAHWLREAARPQRAILDAFVTAGRGLAAAHRAGLVHRDFKPHNVLRDRDGGIFVSDFGLARATSDDEAPTQPSSRHDIGDLASTLTATGTALGTPAYMAPEQHDGKEVGAAADQFAFCVALWEALAGERPFRGETLGELRAAIDRGPSPDQESNIPRPLRAALRRGLAVDPAARWPSMDDLLVAIEPPRRRALAYAGRAAAIVGAGALFFAIRGSGDTTDNSGPSGCGPPQLALATLRADPVRSKLAGDKFARRAVAAVDRYLDDWAAQQPAICSDRADPMQAERLHCLEVVRGELELTLAAFAKVDLAKFRTVEPLGITGDPLACAARPTPPKRVALVGDREQILSIAVATLTDRRANVAEPSDPCLRVRWLLASAHADRAINDESVRSLPAAASEAADRCGDDLIAAGATIGAIGADPGAIFKNADDGLKRVAGAVARSGGDRNFVFVHAMLDGSTSLFRRDKDRAIERLTAAIELAKPLGASRLASIANMLAVQALVMRSHPGDLERAESLALWAIENEPPTGPGKLPERLMMVRFEQQRYPEAIALAHQVVAARAPAPSRDGQPLRGRVIDSQGRPVGGARVVADGELAVFPPEIAPLAPPSRTAVTAPDGSFTIDDAPKAGVVMAELGDLRSQPISIAANATLRLATTGTLRGRLVGRRPDHYKIAIAANARDDVTFAATVRGDEWTIERLPHGSYRIVVVVDGLRRNHRADLTPGWRSTPPIELSMVERGITVRLVLRSEIDAALTMGFAGATRGKLAATKWSEIDKRRDVVHSSAMPLRRDVSDDVRKIARGGDVYAELLGVEPGEVTLCGFGISADITNDRFWNRFEEASKTTPITCKTVTVAAGMAPVMLEVPPMKRLE